MLEINRVCLEETLGGDHHDVRCGAWQPHPLDVSGPAAQN
jgi:hypothetical protein